MLGSYNQKSNYLQRYSCYCHKSNRPILSFYILYFETVKLLTFSQQKFQGTQMYSIIKKGWCLFFLYTFSILHQSLPLSLCVLAFFYIYMKYHYDTTLKSSLMVRSRCDICLILNKASNIGYLYKQVIQYNAFNTQCKHQNSLVFFPLKIDIDATYQHIHLKFKKWLSIHIRVWCLVFV